MDEPISARYVWGPDALVDAWDAHNQLTMGVPLVKYGMRFLLSVILLGSIGIPLMLIFSPSGAIPLNIKGSSVIAMIGFSILWLWVFHLNKNKSSLRWRANRAFRTLPQGAHVVSWSICRESLTNHTTTSSTTMMWPVFLKAVETKKGFLLYQNKNFFNWIPSGAFASAGEMMRFSGIARDQVADYRVHAASQYLGKPPSTDYDF